MHLIGRFNVLNKRFTQVFPQHLCLFLTASPVIVLLILFLLNFFILYWSIADEQRCDSVRCTKKQLSRTYSCIHPPPGSARIQAATERCVLLILEIRKQT